MQHTVFSILDFLVPLLYMTIIMVWAFYYQFRKIKEDSCFRFYTIGLAVKLLGGLSFGLIYKYYYGGGDTFTYYQGARVFYEAFYSDPIVFLKMLFLNAGEYTADTANYTTEIWHFKHGESFFLIKIAAIINVVSMNSYMGCTVLFSFISFLGTWLLYKTMLLDSKSDLIIAVSVLFVPSVFFWGSGVMKDTICFMTLGLLYFAFRKITWNNLLRNSTILIIGSYILLMLKAYILIIFIVSILGYIYWINVKRIKNIFVKSISVPILLSIIVSVGFYLVPTVLNSSEKYQQDQLTRRVEGFHGWHTTLSERGGSGYSLGEVEYTLQGLLRSSPEAINVALFRPYLWEVSNPVNLMASLESAFLLFITLFVLWKSRLKMNILFATPAAKFYFLFSVFFAFIVGFTSYNFGALVRFKIPLIPFYLMFLILAYANAVENRPAGTREVT